MEARNSLQAIRSLDWVRLRTQLSTTDVVLVALREFVTIDVPDYGIVGGNPARLIRTRYSDRDVARLLAVAWWDWPADHITEHVPTIMSGSIHDFEAAAEALK